MICECFWCRETKPIVKWSVGGLKFTTSKPLIVRTWCAECTTYLDYQDVEKYDSPEAAELELLRRSL